MKGTLARILLASSLALAGCASAPEPEAFTWPKDPPREAKPAEDPEPLATNLAPTEKWHADLQKIAPAGWTVDEATDQLDAPREWERMDGGRGLEFTFTNKSRTIQDSSGTHSPTFVVAIFPRGWEGRALTAGLVFKGDKVERVSSKKPSPDKDCTRSARFYGSSGDGWLFFHSALGHEGWEHPEDDVARALSFTKS